MGKTLANVFLVAYLVWSVGVLVLFCPWLPLTRRWLDHLSDWNYARWRRRQRR